MNHLPEYNKSLSILGFKGVKISSINHLISRVREEVEPNHAQFFNAKVVAGEKHLIFATLNALNAHRQGRQISQSLEVEMLLYASGQRQISKAIRLLGVRENTSQIAVASIVHNTEDGGRVEESILKTISGERDQRILGLQEGKLELLKRAFNVTPEELRAASGSNRDPWQALTALIVERSALLAIDR